MFLVLLILLPLIFGVGLAVTSYRKSLGFVGTAISVYLFIFSLLAAFNGEGAIQKEITQPWFKMGDVQTYIALDFSGLGAIMVMLNTFVYSLLFLYFISVKKNYKNNFYGLLLIMFAGLNGVFLAQDLLLFYFFWEIVLIPIYFLIGIWGGKNKVRANTTFFIYTIFGSFLMLAGIIYIGFHLQPKSYLLSDIKGLTTQYKDLQLLPILFLIAFAIKIPLFPLHTWQPPVYKASDTFVTVILSALMAKMGLFAVVNWFIGMFPVKSLNFDYLLYVVGFGLVYASLIALRSNHLKRIIAFSSIAHLALIFMSLFTYSEIGIKGAYFQMFSHGIVVLGMWLSYDYMHRRYGVTDVKSVRGLAKIDPAIAVFWTIFCLSNLSLPLTSNFIGEFSMLNALFLYNPVLCIMGCIGAILSAAYTWRMNNAILLGSPDHIKDKPKRMSAILYLVFGLLSFAVILLGTYPSIIFNLIQN